MWSRGERQEKIRNDNRVDLYRHTNQFRSSEFLWWRSINTRVQGKVVVVRPRSAMG